MKEKKEKKRHTIKENVIDNAKIENHIVANDDEDDKCHG